MRFLITSLLACALVLSSRTVEAHKSSVRRTVFLERFGERELHVIVAIRIPGGDARRAFDLLADTNHDGRYTDTERQGVRNVLAARALDGLAIATGTTALPLEGIEVKDRFEGAEGPVEVMVHATARFLFRSGTTVVFTTGSVGDPVDLVVLPGNQGVRSASRGSLRTGGLKAELGTSDRVDVRLQ